MRKEQIPFPVEFRSVTGAPWDDNPVARAISYEYMIAREEFLTTSVTDFLFSCFQLAVREPDNGVKRELIKSLEKHANNLRHEFEHVEPQAVFDDIKILIRDPRMEGCIMELASFGSVIAIISPHSSRNEFLNDALEIVPPYINHETLPSFKNIMRRFDLLVATAPETASSAYVSLCCRLLRTPLETPEIISWRTQPHDKKRIERQREAADLTSALHKIGEHNLKTAIGLIKNGRRKISDIDVLFDRHNWNALVDIGRLNVPMQKFALQLTTEIEALRNRQFMDSRLTPVNGVHFLTPPYYRPQNNNPPPAHEDITLPFQITPAFDFDVDMPRLPRKLFARAGRLAMFQAQTYEKYHPAKLWHVTREIFRVRNHPPSVEKSDNPFPDAIYNHPGQRGLPYYSLHHPHK